MEIVLVQMQDIISSFEEMRNQYFLWLQHMGKCRSSRE